MSVYPSPADWRDLWIYFLLVDRFNNPSRPPASRWDDPYGKFQGGSFDGVTAQLDFLRDLGVGAIWLSPVLQNVQALPGTYHGYGIQNFTRVEPRFCADPDRARLDAGYGDAQLRTLIDAAHARGLYVILDIVLNHTGDVFDYDGFGGEAPWRDDPPYPVHWRGADGQPNPNWSSPPVEVDPAAAVHPVGLRGNEAFRRRGNAFGAPGHDPAAAGDFFTLKELVTDRQENGRYPVRDTLIACYADIIRRFDVDGFRIDTLMYVEADFARTFGNAMREHAAAYGKKNFFTFGEVYADEQRISGYVGRHTNTGGDLVGVDAALDFPVFYVLPRMAKGQAAPSALVETFRLRRQLEENVISSHGDASRYFVTFLDNHDQPSRYHYRDPTDPDLYDPQLSLGLASLMALQGIPCVYYGTEAGLHGTGNSPEAVREALWGSSKAFDLAQPAAVTLRQLSELRMENAALRYGRQYFRPVSGDGIHFGLSPYPGGWLAWSRILADTEIVVAANTHTTEPWTGHVLVDSTLTSTEAPPRLLYSNQPTPTFPQQSTNRPAGTVTVDDGTGISSGPIRTVAVTLAPMEVQVFTTAPPG